MGTYSEFRSTLEKFDVEELINSKQLLITEDQSMESYYIPFDSINKNAKVVLVGITPGKTQWRNAMHAAKNALIKGVSDDEVLRLAKNSGAFSGAIRSNLVKMLDHVGINAKLGISTTADLFDKKTDLVHMTSLLRNPIFIDGKNYSGSSPKMLKSDFLTAQIESYFVQETKILPNAIYIPMGHSVSEVLNHLASKGVLKPEQILNGFPHPSGANAERIKYFIDEKPVDKLSAKTSSTKIDADKVLLLNKLANIKF